MKNILKYLGALCPCPLSLFLCRSFLPILKSTSPCFLGLLQTLSCPSHLQRVVPTGCSLPPLSAGFKPLLWVFHCQVCALGPSCCQTTLCSWSSVLCRLRHSQEPSSSAVWALPTPVSVSLTMGTEKPPGTEPQQGLGQIWMGLAWYLPNLPCFLLAAGEFLLSLRIKPSMILQDCKYKLHEPTELSRAGIFICERIFHKCEKVKKSLHVWCLRLKIWGTSSFLLLIHFMQGWHCTNSSSCVWFPFFF